MQLRSCKAYSNPVVSSLVEQGLELVAHVPGDLDLNLVAARMLGKLDANLTAMRLLGGLNVNLTCLRLPGELDVNLMRMDLPAGLVESLTAMWSHGSQEQTVSLKMSPPA